MALLERIYTAVYGVPTVIAIFILFFIISIKTRFVGVRKIGASVKAVINGNKHGKSGDTLKAVCVSLCATVGTGNIVGVAGAVSIGGPGAVFWMWISALLSLSVKFSEIYLSLVYKKKSSAYGYIYAAVKSEALRRAFLIFGIITAFGIGNLTQTNAAADSIALFTGGMSISPSIIRIVTGIVFMLLCLVILIRENSAVSFCEKFLPFMAAAYILLCLAALVSSRKALPKALSLIFRGAFCPMAVTGGAVGSIIAGIKSGMARGIFSNEAGLSTAALAYEKSKTAPYETALFGIFEVLIDTMLLCTLTALVVISSNSVAYGSDFGAYSVLCAFISVLGNRSILFLCPIICFFAFSSVIGWGIYARRFAEKCGFNTAVLVCIYAITCIIGAAVTADAAWMIAEMSSLSMMFVNCYSLIFHRNKLSYKNLVRLKH